jgi:predicted dehydrogenase
MRSFVLALLFAACLLPASAQDAPPVRVAVVGLVHDHVIGFLKQTLPAHPNIQLVGISEPDAALRTKYAAYAHLPASLFFASEAEMLQATHPQAILVYTSIAGHRAAIEQAAPLHIAAMVEKPLATTVADALAIQALSQRYNVPVLTNYETTWYRSNTEAHAIFERGSIGPLRKLVAHDGHRGPAEIGVSPDFLRWLTDPVQNGAGALVDFGCYGIDLATWFQHGQLPLTVTAVGLHLKPNLYPKVEDDSTVILTYPQSQAIIQGSWNWPFDRKDMEVYGSTGYVDTVYQDKAPGAEIRLRLPGDPAEHLEQAPPLPADQADPLNFLAAVLAGRLKPEHDLTSLDTNVTVVLILDAARRSIQTGRTIRLTEELAH